MIIRSSIPGDEEALRAVCRRAILVSGRELYTPQELEAWAGFTADRKAFRDFLGTQRALVAVQEGRPVGFAGLGDDGYLASLYVAPEHARRGIGAALVRRLLHTGRREGLKRFHAHASKVALPLFQALGFTVLREEEVLRGGVPLLRYVVVREEATT